MTRSVRLGAVLLLLLGLALGGWWWLAPASATSEPPGTGATTAPDAVAPAPPPPTSRAVPLAEAAAPSDGGVAVIEVVSAEDGQPLPGASVAVRSASAPRHWHFRHGGPRGFTGESDARGRVEVPPQSGDDLILFVVLDYYVPYLGPYVPGTQVVLERLPPAQGRVLNERGQPVEGAMVTSTVHERVATRSAADGSFSLSLPRAARLLAEKDGAVAVSPPARDDDSPQPLVLVLAAPTQRAGRVIGRDGSPLAGVTVTAAVRAVSWVQSTGDDGAFRVPELPGVPVALSFAKPGYVTVEEPELLPLTGEVVLSRPARLEGQLVDQGGRPLADHEVHLLDPVARFQLEETSTDAEGRFAFEDLGEPEVVLHAMTEALEQTELAVQVPEGETTRVTLALRPELQPVPVEYVSSQQVEVTGCETVATPVPPSGWSSRADLGSDLELRRGRYDFVVRCIDGRGAHEVLDVQPRPDMAPLRFVVASDAGEVFEDELPLEPVLVRVVTPTGQPVEGADVECYTARGVTGPDGRFRCEVRAGDGIWPLHVHATKGDARGLARATGKEPEVQVVLRSSVTLRGRIDGALPPGRLIVSTRSAADTGSQPFSGNTFALEGRPAIRTFVCVERVVEGRSPTTETLGCAVSENGDEVVIRIGAPGRLTFSALGADGKPQPYPVVYVDRVRQDVEAPLGEVTLEVPAGEHVLVLNTEDSRARHETRFTVRPGEVTALGGLKLE